LKKYNPLQETAIEP